MRVIETAEGFRQPEDNGLVFEDQDGDVFQYATLTSPVRGEPWLLRFGDEMGLHLAWPSYPVKVLREGHGQ